MKMKENVKAFIKYVYDHPSVQKKLEEAGKNCNERQTREDIFQSVFLPVAEEAGFSISYEDVESAIQDMQKAADVKPLDMDEMSQVAGGADEATVGGGLGGVVGCNWVGAGLGGTAGSGQWGLCVGLGVGFGSGVCLGVGGSSSDKEKREQEDREEILRRMNPTM